MRLECCDDVIFAGNAGFNTSNDVSLTGSLEIRFGGSRKNYWPWNPGGQHSWW